MKQISFKKTAQNLISRCKAECELHGLDNYIDVANLVCDKVIANNKGLRLRFKKVKQIINE